jgi:hypothetical protein
MKSHQCQECSVHSSKAVSYFLVTITGQYAPSQGNMQV